MVDISSSSYDAALLEKAKRRAALKITIWENLQLLTLAGSIAGQITIGMSFLLGQGLFAVANVIALTRDFVLHRPAADKIKDGALLAMTLALIGAYYLGAYH